MMLRTWMIMWKEFIQIRRDPRLLGVVLALPVVMLIIYGYAFNLDVRHVRMVIYDQDRSQASRELIGDFTHSGYFDTVAYAGSYRELARIIDTDQARVALVIPVRFARELAAGRTAQVQLLVDGSDSTTASTAVGYAGVITQQYSVKVAVQALRHAGMTGNAAQPVEQRTRYWYNPELKSTNFLIPGLFAVILMMLSALLTSVTVTRERERGTIESLIVSPVMPLELMLGKLIPYAVIAYFDVILIMATGALIFHVPLKGNPLLVFLLSGIFLMAALGIGLLISAVSKTQQLAMTIAMMITQLPSVLMSGFIFPIASMPKAIQVVTNIIPAAHFIRILRAIYLKGSGLALIWPSVVTLLGLGMLMLLLSAARFKKKL